MNALDSGSSVGRYRIEQFLGAGAMGEVYLAEDPQIDRKLAIKTVRLVGRPQEIEERKKRLLREARAAGRLLHPNVVTLFDAGEAEGLLYLAFEFVEGTDLAARLDGGERPSLREVLRIGRQAAEALDYAHGQGIVHRDIKPSNILLDRSGRVKVADFGIAKMAGQSTELTMAGSVMGSPQYLSPEQIRGEDLDGRSDQFSLGVVLYELLSGKRPFGGDTITTLVYQILHVEPPPVSELRAVPPRLEVVLLRMLAKNRDDRFAATGEVARELAAIEAELSDETLSAPAGSGAYEATKLLPRRDTDVPPPPPARSTRGTVPASPATTPSVPPPPPAVLPPIPVAPPPPPPGVTSPKRSLLWVPIVAALLIIAALAGAWYMLSRPSPPAPEQTLAEQSPPTAMPAAAPAGTPGAAGPSASSPQIQTPPAAAGTVAPAPAVRPVPRSPATGNAAGSGSTAVATEPVGAARRPRDLPPTEAAAPATEDVRREPEPVSREPEPAPEPSQPPAVAQQDQTLRTGLNVAFRVFPPGAFVLIDGRVIGTAQQWSGGKGSQPYTFPEPGAYQIKIKAPEMKDYLIGVQAEATRGTTPIAVRLQPLPAAEVDSTDLRTVRVRTAVAFRVQPPMAGVQVDDQPMGLARRFSGGGMLRGRGEWLELTPGKHRVSFMAPGFRRKDVLVEVTATAERDRERIDVVLAPGGGGE